jgi:seryl-tRNA synthetase
MLDLNLFRTGENKDGKPPGLVRTSQLRRFASVELVDEVIALGGEWRRLRFSLDKLRQELNAAAKKIGKLKVTDKQEDEEEAKKLVEGTNDIKKRQAAMEAEEQKTKSALDAKLMAIGNILHESVPVAADEANNVTLRVFGDRRMEQNLMNHVDLCVALDIVDLKRGVAAAGGRGFYLKKEGAALNRALANFGIEFLQRRGYEEIDTPHMMTKEAMGKCAQLCQSLSTTRGSTSWKAKASTSSPRRSSLWRTTTMASSSVPTSCRSGTSASPPASGKKPARTGATRPASSGRTSSRRSSSSASPPRTATPPGRCTRR